MKTLPELRVCWAALSVGSTSVTYEMASPSSSSETEGITLYAESPDSNGNSSIGEDLDFKWRGIAVVFAEVRDSIWRHEPLAMESIALRNSLWLFGRDFTSLITPAAFSIAEVKFSKECGAEPISFFVLPSNSSINAQRLSSESACKNLAALLTEVSATQPKSMSRIAA